MTTVHTDGALRLVEGRSTSPTTVDFTDYVQAMSVHCPLPRAVGRARVDAVDDLRRRRSSPRRPRQRSSPPGSLWRRRSGAC